MKQARLAQVNDLKLVHHKNGLFLISFDVGFRGLLRRLVGERLWGPHQQNLWVAFGSGSFPSV